MFIKYILPILAISGVGYAAYSVREMSKSPPATAPFEQPASRDLLAKNLEDELGRQLLARKLIAGSGLIEASQENIPIGTAVPGLVMEVFVKIGDHVQKGEKLFQIDDRTLRSELMVREAELRSAQATLDRLRFAPRPEDVPPVKAAVEEAQAKLNDAEAALARSERLRSQQMIPASDYDRDRYSSIAARATLARANADLEKLLAGTWEKDLGVAQAGVALAQANVERVKLELERHTVNALANGEVLQVNIRPGQFAAATWKEPMIVLGDLKRYHVRIDIDEHDLPWFQRKAWAIATVKGKPTQPFLLDFVKIEPYVIPKRSLTGESVERVDTRVLQVVYALPEGVEGQLYVGQQLDAYLASKLVKSTDIDDDLARLKQAWEVLSRQSSPSSSSASRSSAGEVAAPAKEG